jgi:hypothetical protein
MTKFIQFFKRHYEKIILSLVLAALAGAAVWLSVAVREVNEEISRTNSTQPHRDAPWVGVESSLGPLRDALKGMVSVPPIELTGEHNLVNPVTWKMLPDGSKIKMLKAGADALVVTDIRPLYFTITLQDHSRDIYYLEVKHTLPSYGKTIHYQSMINDKPTERKPYPVVSTNPPGAPPGTLALLVKIPEAATNVLVTDKTPYQWVEGYEVDMTYNGSDVKSPLPLMKKHQDDLLKFSGDFYKIIAITNDSVTMQDTNVGRKTTLEWKGGH